MALSRGEAAQRLVVALDASEAERLLALAHTLRGHVGMVKVGLEAFTAVGPSLVAQLDGLGLPVFLDLKLHDIPNTVDRAARNCAGLGVRALTVHASGGEAMLAAAVTGAEAGKAAGRPRPLVLAVTVLTSLDNEALERLGISGGAAARVWGWAAMAHRAGCDGVVCSPRELAMLRRDMPPDFVLLSPGIRPAGAAADDQRRVATPSAALAAGADYLVVGRPITAAGDPAAAAEAIIAEMCSTDNAGDPNGDIASQ
jgi:orotidine-5'-phosphate decarboxylase